MKIRMTRCSMVLPALVLVLGLPGCTFKETKDGETTTRSLEVLVSWADAQARRTYGVFVKDESREPKSHSGSADAFESTLDGTALANTNPPPVDSQAPPSGESARIDKIEHKVAILDSRVTGVESQMAGLVEQQALHHEETKKEFAKVHDHIDGKRTETVTAQPATEAIQPEEQGHGQQQQAAPAPRQPVVPERPTVFVPQEQTQPDIRPIMGQWVWVRCPRCGRCFWQWQAWQYR